MNKILTAIILMSAATGFSDEKIYEYRSKFDPDFVYQLNVSKIFTVTKIDSALVASRRPITLTISCEETELAKKTHFFEARSLNKSQSLDATARITSKSCAANSLKATFITPGLTITEGPMDFVWAKEGASYEGIKKARQSKSVDLVRVASALANAAGSRESLHCIIKAYDNDPLMTGIIEELTTLYGKLYGTYDASLFQCPVAAEGVLARNVEVCENDGSNISQFCLLHARYRDLEKWYDDSITRLGELRERLDAASDALRVDIDQLITQLQSEINAQRDTMNPSGV